jgi:hypothetical protein
MGWRKSKSPTVRKEAISKASHHLGTADDYPCSRMGLEAFNGRNSRAEMPVSSSDPDSRSVGQGTLLRSGYVVPMTRARPEDQCRSISLVLFEPRPTAY